MHDNLPVQKHFRKLATFSLDPGFSSPEFLLLQQMMTMTMMMIRRLQTTATVAMMMVLLSPLSSVDMGVDVTTSDAVMYSTSVVFSGIIRLHFRT